jgi:hypothetical protein
MAGWTTNSPNSRIFQAAMLNPLLQHVNPGSLTSPTGYSDLVATDTIDVSLFNNTTTPDATVAVASSGYNTGVWVTGNEVTDATNWVAGGRALASKAFSYDSGSVSQVFHAANLAGGGNVTIANAYGCLVYDLSITAGTVAKQGLCFNYFGGAQAVTAGTFTIVWATVGGTTGVFNIAV